MSSQDVTAEFDAIVEIGILVYSVLYAPWTLNISLLIAALSPVTTLFSLNSITANRSKTQTFLNPGIIRHHLSA